MSGLSLYADARSHDSGECPNKGCLGKLLTHFVKLCFTSFNFNSAFLGGRCLAQFIVASLMEPDIRKDVRLLLFWGIRSHDSGECPNKGCFGKLLIHFADCSSASFNFYSLFLKLLLSQ